MTIAPPATIMTVYMHVTQTVLQNRFPLFYFVSFFLVLCLGFEFLSHVMHSYRADFYALKKMPEIIQSKHIYTLAHVNSHLLHFAASGNNYFSI